MGKSLGPRRNYTRQDAGARLRRGRQTTHRSTISCAAARTSPTASRLPVTTTINIPDGPSSWCASTRASCIVDLRPCDARQRVTRRRQGDFLDTGQSQRSRPCIVAETRRSAPSMPRSGRSGPLTRHELNLVLFTINGITQGTDARRRKRRCGWRRAARLWTGRMRIPPRCGALPVARLRARAEQTAEDIKVAVRTDHWQFDVQPRTRPSSAATPSRMRSGIHQDGVLKNAATYEIMTAAESVGWSKYQRRRRWLQVIAWRRRRLPRSKLAALAAMAIVGSPTSGTQTRFAGFKDLADRKKVVYATSDITALVDARGAA